MGRLADLEMVPVRGGRAPFVPILLEADESESVLRSYLNDGDLFEIRSDGRTVGVCLLIDEGASIEIKNIAIVEGSRGRGLGTLAIAAIAEVARSRGARRLIVGTAETSTRAIAFYRRLGFRDDGIKAGFFDAYPEPVVEDGRVAHDMMMFAMDLRTPGPDQA